HAAPRVEERGRAVAPLLDVGRERGADKRRAHLLRDRAERRAEKLELNIHDRVSTSVVDPSLTPSHPGATQQVAPRSSTSAGPSRRSGSPGGSSNAGPGRASAVRTATSSTVRLRSA